MSQSRLRPMSDNQDLRETFTKFLTLWGKNHLSHHFAEFVLSCLCDVVGEETVKDEIMDMELHN